MRLAADLDPDCLVPFEVAREGIRTRMLQDRFEELGEAFFAWARRTLEALPVRVEDGVCVEAWPEHPIAALSFEGNRVLGDEELTGLAAGSVGCGGTTWTSPDLDLVRTLIRAAYLDLGYVEVSIVAEGAPSGGVTLEIEEGEQFRIGTVRVVVRAADGSESEPAPDEMPPLPAHPVPGDVFSRREVGEAMHFLAAEFAAVWGFESVGVEPEVEVRGGSVVELTLVVHLP